MFWWWWIPNDLATSQWKCYCIYDEAEKIRVRDCAPLVGLAKCQQNIRLKSFLGDFIGTNNLEYHAWNVVIYLLILNSVYSSSPHRWLVSVTCPPSLITIPPSTPCVLFRMTSSPLFWWGHFRRIAIKDRQVMPYKLRPAGIPNWLFWTKQSSPDAYL